MQYYQCEKYPIEFMLSENIDKHLILIIIHNYVRHYIILLVMQGVAVVFLENRKLEYPLWRKQIYK